MSTITDIPQLSVENFGAIQHANVDLRPLTVFVGPTNTGKSYLAILIYALHCYFGSDHSRFFLRSQRELRRLLRSELPDGTAELRDSLTIIGKHLEKIELDDPQDPVDVSIPEPLAHTLRQMLGESTGFGLSDEIIRCFGLNTELLRRWGANHPSRVTLRIRPFENAKPLEHHLTWEAGQHKTSTVVPENMPLIFRRENSEIIPPPLTWLYSSKLELENSLPNDHPQTWIGRIQLLEFIAYHLSRSLYGRFGQSAYYLPANRTGVMHAHKSVVNSILKRASVTGEYQVLTNSLPSGVLVDFLEGMLFSETINLFPSEIELRPKEIITICSAIENDILKGAIKVDYSDALNYPQFSYQPNAYNASLPLRNTSSMISELAPIILYLRHRVDQGDVLIIEEPEAHLHPSMQITLTRQLAALVNAGVRIIVTTHSTWMLKELANLIRLSSQSNSSRDGDHASLTAEEVGVWMFQEEKSSEGSTATQIDLDESDMYPSDFDDASSPTRQDD